MSRGTSLDLTWAGIVSVPRKPYETPGGLNLPGHRLMWKVGVLNYTDARTPKDPQGQLKSRVVSGVFCFGFFMEEKGTQLAVSYTQKRDLLPHKRHCPSGGDHGWLMLGNT